VTHRIAVFTFAGALVLGVAACGDNSGPSLDNQNPDPAATTIPLRNGNSPQSVPNGGPGNTTKGSVEDSDNTVPEGSVPNGNSSAPSGGQGTSPGSSPDNTSGSGAQTGPG
jgi:hypothetical protein